MAKGEDITTKFKVDISDLKKGITEANNILKTNKSQLNVVKSEMEAFGKSADGMRKSIDIMKSSLDAQTKKLQSYKQQLTLAQKAEEQSSQKVQALKQQLERAKSMYGENSTQVAKYQAALSNAEKVEASMKQQVANLTVTMNNQQATVNKTEKEMTGLKTELTAVEQAEARAAKSGKSVEDELRNMNKEAKNAGDGFTVMKGAMANLVAQGIAKAIDGIKKLAEATGQLVVSSVKAYAQYEQLVGGVETIFGAGGQSLEEYAKRVGKTVTEAQSEYDKLMKSQTTVMENSKVAYETAGMSANQYMENITGFSASLIQSLGGDTEKAAEYGNRAIIDMSDNANKMGTDMGRITDAYQGFAKQNYTMLD